MTVIIFVLTSSASANSSVASGTITEWKESTNQVYLDDYVSVESQIVAWWSISSVDDKTGYFYGYNYTTDVARVGGITDICEVSDASIFDYNSWSSGIVTAGDFVLFHNTSTDYYAAFRVDDIYGPAILHEDMTDVTWYLQENGSANFGPCELIVLIDIKTGSNSNIIKLNSPGVVTVAVLTTEEFEASTIDPVTVLFSGASPQSWSMKDIDRDGDIDLLFQFKILELTDLNEYSNEATLTGMTFDGNISIIGTDSVHIK